MNDLPLNNSKDVSVLTPRISATKAFHYGTKPALFFATQIVLLHASPLIALTVTQTGQGESDAAISDESHLSSVDISKWRCRLCEDMELWSAKISLGMDYVFDDSYKFGEYNTFKEAGGYTNISGIVKSRDEQLGYLDLEFHDLGLDSHSLSIKGGRQGRHDAYLEFNEITHTITDSVWTPYSGTDALTLPLTWVAASTTGQMDTLDTSLREIELATERKRLGAGIQFTTRSPWRYRFDVRHEDKQGKKQSAGTFFFHAAHLVEPVDYVTNEIDATIFYTQKQWQASLGYYASLFRNDNTSLIWENAFNPVIAGANLGQRSLPPDNQYHQITLAVNYNLNERNHFSGDIFLGRMRQNETFLPPTINQLISAPTLTAESANAKVETTNARLNYFRLVSDNLNLTAHITYDERNNKTPSFWYTPITTDAVISAQQINRPYGYIFTSLELNADYAYSRYTQFELGAEHNLRKRDYVSIDKTEEDTFWSLIRLRQNSMLSLDFKLAHSKREAMSHVIDPNTNPTQNILMKKYNMADRDRRALSLHANITSRSNVGVGISVDSARDEYHRSQLGLTESRDSSSNIDVSVILSPTANLNFFLAQQKIETAYNGSQNFSTPDWSATNDDSLIFWGLGVRRMLIEEKLEIGIDYKLSRSRGKIYLKSGTAFTELQTDNESIQLSLDYHHNTKTFLRMLYWHEEYDTDDWALDGLMPTTVTNFLAHGQASASYNIEVIGVIIEHQF
jgi:MtrB/PioB family decaheme-associated outer membrane protein